MTHTANAAHTNNTEVDMSDADIAYEAACMEATFGEDYTLDAEVDLAWLASYIAQPAPEGYGYIFDTTRVFACDACGAPSNYRCRGNCRYAF
jgi:hypothetical protein